MANEKNGLAAKVIAGVCVAGIGFLALGQISNSSDVKVHAQLLSNHNIRIGKSEARDAIFFEDLSQIKGDIREIRVIMEHQAKNNK